MRRPGLHAKCLVRRHLRWMKHRANLENFCVAPQVREEHPGNMGGGKKGQPSDINPPQSEESNRAGEGEREAAVRG